MKLTDKFHTFVYFYDDKFPRYLTNNIFVLSYCDAADLNVASYFRDALVDKVRKMFREISF